MPDPVPLPVPTVIQLALDVAVHVQPVPVVTPTDPLPAVALNDADTLDNVYVQPKLNVLDAALRPSPPGPTASTRAT